MKAAAPLLLLVGTTLAPRATGQETSPSPDPPERLFQDELDLQANANFVQGSGARAFGMGGAFLARADDATAASWNPAGLSYLGQPELSLVYVGGDFKSSRRDFGDVLQSRDTRSSRAPDFFAVTQPYETDSLSGAVQLSFQRLISFSSNRTIEDLARFANSPSDSPFSPRTVDAEGGFDIIALGTGARVSRGIRVGFTLNRWFNGYRYRIEKPDRAIASRQSSKLELDGWNVHAGVILSPWDSLNLGVVVKTGLTASASLSRSRVDLFPEQTSNAYSSNDLRFVLPSSVGTGISWRSRSNLTLSLDYTRSDWSVGRVQNFFTLARQNAPNPNQGPTPQESGDFYPSLPYPTLDDERQPDTEQYRAGVEYVVIKSRLKWPLRAGFFSDRQFFRDREGKAPVFIGYTAGTGLILGRTLLDIAYVYSSGSYTDRSELRNQVRSHKLYASVIYRHSRRP